MQNPSIYRIVLNDIAQLKPQKIIKRNKW